MYNKMCFSQKYYQKIKVVYGAKGVKVLNVWKSYFLIVAVGFANITVFEVLCLMLSDL